MSDSSNPLIIAIDGGGTRCRIALRQGESEVSVETGSANVSTNFDGTLSQIDAGLRELASCANIAPEAFREAFAFVGLAGMTGPEIATRLKQHLPFARMRVEDDRPAAVRGALGPADGVIAHCGTGSFFAAQIGGDIRLAGGWGPVLGDEASAHIIARAALRATLASVDGMADETPLARHFLKSLNGAAGIVRFAGQASPRDIGALAPQVTQFATDGDALAMRVLQDAADHIADSLTTIGWQPGRAICLTGGIAPHHATYLPAKMQIDLAQPAGTPLAGALSLADDLARDGT